MSIQAILKNEASVRNYRSFYSVIIQVLIIYNCRISEILSAEWSNFNPDRFLILKGAKRSANVIITDRALLKQINELPRLHASLIFPTVTQHQISHYILKNYSHLLTNIKIKKNRKITHAFRYLNIAGIVNDNFIKDILHHNSKRSGAYYKNKLKGS